MLLKCSVLHPPIHWNTKRRKRQLTGWLNLQTFYRSGSGVTELEATRVARSHQCLQVRLKTFLLIWCRVLSLLAFGTFCAWLHPLIHPELVFWMTSFSRSWVKNWSILLMRQDQFATSAELPNLFFRIFIFRKLMSRHWWPSRLFLLVFQKNRF